MLMPLTAVALAVAGGTLTMIGCDRPTAEPARSTEVETPPLQTPLLEPWHFIETGRPDVARMRLRRLVPDDTFTAQSAFLMGLTYHVEDRYGSALPWLERACAGPEVYPPAEHFRGWALYWLGRPDDARDAFTRHLELTPSEGDSHFGLALIHLDAAHWDAAEHHLHRAIDLQHQRGDRLDGVAKAKARLAEVVEHRDRDLEQAQQLLAEALTLDGTMYEAGFKRARLLQQLGRSDEADAQHADAVTAREAARQ